MVQQPVVVQQFAVSASGLSNRWHSWRALGNVASTAPGSVAPVAVQQAVAGIQQGQVVGLPGVRS